MILAVTAKSLETVRVAAAEAERARDALHRAIRQAAKTESLRTIAEAAGLSHEHCRRIVQRIY